MTSAPFQLCALDLIGPIPHSQGVAQFALMIVYHYTRFMFCYPLKSKDQTYQALTNWVKYVERRFQPFKVSAIQTDWGSGFCSVRLTKWFENQGIRHRLIDPATPAQNGLAERQCQKLQTVARCLLRDSGLSMKYWAEAYNMACYLINRL